MKGHQVRILVRRRVQSTFIKCNYGYCGNKLEVIIGIERIQFPFTYLGCAIFHMRRKKDYYKHIITKFSNKLQAWKGKLLSFEGRDVLIKHVLLSIPIHQLPAVNPPKNVIEHLQKLYALFFWSSCVGGKNKKWSFWKNL